MLALPPLLSLVLMIALVGFLVWLVTTYVPMPEPFKRLILVVVIVFLLVWLARLVGLL